MILSHIVAAGERNEIGRDNDLLWRLPNDLKFFKNTTWGMPVLMGRKTYESIAREPLPGRMNLILTRQSDYDPGSPKAIVVHSLEVAIQKAAAAGVRELFIAGGGSFYQESLPVANRIYLTRVHHDFPEADVFYPEIRNSEWKLQKELSFSKDAKHPFAYTFQLWER
jgi:dihydrofolate reductase